MIKNRPIASDAEQGYRAQNVTEEAPITAISLASKRGDPENPYYVLRGSIKSVNLLHSVVEIEPVQITSNRMSV